MSRIISAQVNVLGQTFNLTGNQLSELKYQLGAQDRSSSCTIKIVDPDLKISDVFYKWSKSQGGIKIPAELRGGYQSPSTSNPVIPPTTNPTNPEKPGNGNGGSTGTGNNAGKLEGLESLPVSFSAFLEVIGWCENRGYSDKPGWANLFYNVRFGGFLFSDYSRHPDIVYCSGGLCSNAAGAFQFIGGDPNQSWEDLRNLYPKELPGSFLPKYQNIAAMLAIKHYAGRSNDAYNRIIKGTDADITTAARGLSWFWASLPGAPYGQPTVSDAQFLAKYKECLKKRESSSYLLDLSFNTLHDVQNNYKIDSSGWKACPAYNNVRQQVTIGLTKNGNEDDVYNAVKWLVQKNNLEGGFCMANTTSGDTAPAWRSKIFPAINDELYTYQAIFNVAGLFVLFDKLKPIPGYNSPGNYVKPKPQQSPLHPDYVKPESGGEATTPVKDPNPGEGIPNRVFSQDDIKKYIHPGIIFLGVGMGQAFYQGTGMIIESDGTFMTNWHMVSDSNTGAEYTTKTAILRDGTRTTFTVINRNKTKDMAVCKLAAIKTYRPVPVSKDDSPIKAGAKIWASGMSDVGSGDPLVLGWDIEDGNILRVSERCNTRTGETGSTVQCLRETAYTAGRGDSGGAIISDRGLVIAIIHASAEKNIGTYDDDPQEGLDIRVDEMRSYYKSVTGRDIPIPNIVTSVNQEGSANPNPGNPVVSNPGEKLYITVTTSEGSFKHTYILTDTEVSEFPVPALTIQGQSIRYSLDQERKAENYTDVSPQELIQIVGAKYGYKVNDYTQSIGAINRYEQRYRTDLDLALDVARNTGIILTENDLGTELEIYDSALSTNLVISDIIDISFRDEGVVNETPQYPVTIKAITSRTLLALKPETQITLDSVYNFIPDSLKKGTWVINTITHDVLNSETTIDLQKTIEKTIAVPNPGAGTGSGSGNVSTSTFTEQQLLDRYKSAVVRVGSASGAFITSDGYILTAAHMKGSTDVVTLDGKRLTATEIGIDNAQDFMILKVNITGANFFPIAPDSKIWDSDKNLATNPIYKLGHGWTSEDGKGEGGKTVKPWDITASNVVGTRVSRSSGTGNGKYIEANDKTIDFVNPGDSGCPWFDKWGFIVSCTSGGTRSHAEGAGKKDKAWGGETEELNAFLTKYKVPYTKGSRTTAAPPSVTNPPIVNPPIANALGQKIVASMNTLGKFSTTESGLGRNPCMWGVNKVLRHAGLKEVGSNPNYVPSAREALQAGRGRLIRKDGTYQGAQPGDIWIYMGSFHVGIFLTSSIVRSTSSSRERFDNDDSDGTLFGTYPPSAWDGQYNNYGEIWRLNS